MRLLITGTEGFIGKTMLKACQSNVRFESIDTFDTKVNDVEYFKSILIKIRQGYYDLVVHIGAITSTTENDWEKIMLYNFSMTREIFDACLASKTRVQFSSSASLYADTEFPMKETWKLYPKSPYSISKYLCEKYAEEINNVTPLIQIFRYFNVFSYDEREKHKGNQASPQHKFSKVPVDQPIKLFKGSASIFRDFIHVDDVVGIQMLFMFTLVTGVFNIGTGVATSFLDIAENLSKKIEYIDIPPEIKRHYQYYTLADMEKTKDVFKYVQTIMSLKN